MVFFLGNPFFSDFFLFVASLGILFLPRFLEEEGCTDRLTTQKKKFFLALRLLQVLLVFVFFYDISIVFFESATVWGADVVHVGNYFFRAGLFAHVVNCALTLLMFIYCSLLMFLFSRAIVTVSNFVLEIPFLLACTLLGLRLIIATNDFFLLVILLELVAFCSVIFIGLQVGSGGSFRIPLEATVKYFIINGIAVVMLLLGLAGYFYLTAESNLREVMSVFQHNYHLVIFFFEQVCFSYLVVLLAFVIKVGGAPAHNWVPDVYEGAETVVTCFLVLLVSPPLLVKLMQVLKGLSGPVKNVVGNVDFMDCFVVEPGLEFAAHVSGSAAWLVGLVSIIAGTLGAYYQTRIKRFIAYASITHFGFMFLAVGTFTFFGYFAALFYLFIYVFTNLAFFLLLLLSQYYFYPGSNRLIFINQLKPYMQASIFFFLGFLVCILSFAGIPPFAGFFAKFFILMVLLGNGLEATSLVILAAILTGTFVYLRFIKIALFEPGRGIGSVAFMFGGAGTQLVSYRVASSTFYPFYVRYIGIWQERLFVTVVFILGCLTIFGWLLSFGLTSLLALTFSFLVF